MKHIKELLAAREKMLLSHRSEKGSSEWGAFNAVRDDRIELFPSAEHRVSSLRYPNVVHITRLPRQLRPRPAR